MTGRPTLPDRLDPLRHCEPPLTLAERRFARWLARGLPFDALQVRLGERDEPLPRTLPTAMAWLWTLTSWLLIGAICFPILAYRRTSLAIALLVGLLIALLWLRRRLPRLRAALRIMGHDICVRCGYRRAGGVASWRCSECGTDHAGLKMRQLWGWDHDAGLLRWADSETLVVDVAGARAQGRAAPASVRVVLPHRQGDDETPPRAEA